MSIRLALTQQQLTSQTIFSDITLTAKNDRIQINGMGPRLAQAPLPPEVPYKEALSDYLNIWRSRLLTIVQNEGSILSADLSGGLDSRVVFSFLVSAGASKMGSDRFRLASNQSHEDDFRAANNVATEYGFQLNTKYPSAKTSIDYGNALSSWKETCLGTYLPLYFINQDFDPLYFQAHGAGGESYRNYYAPGRGPSDLERYREYFFKEEFEEWRHQVDSELNALATREPRVDPEISHYREFRNRMHFGHRPHRRAMYMPLNSLYLDRVYDRSEPIEERQVYFDIMEALAPGLMDLPYDVSSKAPTKSNRVAITTVNVDTTVVPGRSYVDSPSEVSAGSPQRNAYKQWLAEAAAALERPEVRDFIGEEAITRARAGLAEANQVSRPLGANDKGILELSYVLTVKFALG